MVPIDATPQSAIYRQAEDFRKQEQTEAKRREEERKRAIAAELRRKAGETNQKR